MSTLDWLMDRAKSFPYWTVLTSEFASMKTEDAAKDVCITQLTTRNAELEEEVARLRDALQVIANEDSWRSGNTDTSIARNALKETGL